MSDDAASLPYDTADYLETPEDIAAYLEAVMEDGDERILLSALQDAVRAAKRIMPAETSGLPDAPHEPTLASLISLLHALGFELSVRPKRAA